MRVPKVLEPGLLLSLQQMDFPNEWTGKILYPKGKTSASLRSTYFPSFSAHQQQGKGQGSASFSNHRSLANLFLIKTIIIL